ncbi:putative T6SS immunity periplasmic lipoprotein [Serratia rubidaea]|uniref:putative T6SS immunity periplasmic lipoprotein n=1 Tax=Serratia rubidaea TaxID=61652 RepID=UPI003AEF6832
MGHENIFIICSILIISGCSDPGDRLPETLHADVTLKGNSPCILYPTKLGERITSIQIASETDNSFSKLFDNSPSYSVSSQCLPTFDYHFNVDKECVVYYGLDNDKRQRLIQTTFHFQGGDNK